MSRADIFRCRLPKKASGKKTVKTLALEKARSTAAAAAEALRVLDEATDRSGEAMRTFSKTASAKPACDLMDTALTAVKDQREVLQEASAAAAEVSALGTTLADLDTDTWRVVQDVVAATTEMESQYAELGSVRKIGTGGANSISSQMGSSCCYCVCGCPGVVFKSSDCCCSRERCPPVGTQFGNGIHGGERSSCSNRRHRRAWTGRTRMKKRLLTS